METGAWMVTSVDCRIQLPPHLTWFILNTPAKKWTEWRSSRPQWIENWEPENLGRCLSSATYKLGNLRQTTSSLLASIYTLVDGLTRQLARWLWEKQPAIKHSLWCDTDILKVTTGRAIWHCVLRRQILRLWPNEQYPPCGISPFANSVTSYCCYCHRDWKWPPIGRACPHLSCKPFMICRTKSVGP